MNQRTITVEHKRESMQLMTTETRDRYQQTENKNSNKIF